MRKKIVSFGMAAVAFSLAAGLAPRAAHATLSELTNLAAQREGAWTPIDFEGVGGLSDLAALREVVAAATTREATDADALEVKATITVPRERMFDAIASIGKDARKANVAYRPSPNILERMGQVRFDMAVFGDKAQTDEFKKLLTADPVVAAD